MLCELINDSEAVERVVEGFEKPACDMPILQEIDVVDETLERLQYALRERTLARMRFFMCVKARLVMRVLAMTGETVDAPVYGILDARLRGTVALLREEADCGDFGFRIWNDEAEEDGVPVGEAYATLFADRDWEWDRDAISL